MILALQVPCDSYTAQNTHPSPFSPLTPHVYEGSFKKFPESDVGLALIIAVDATTIEVFPFDAPDRLHISLNPGDILLIRGDCGHVGDSNVGINPTFIIHGYLDSPVEGCTRLLDKKGD